MAKRKQTPARPRDLNQLAVHIGKIATQEIEDELPPAVDPAATKRGEARAKYLTDERKKEIASKAARARWDKEKGRS
jgi:hypothetical protein